MNRYIRLDTMWDASPWLIPLAEGAQLSWVKLLCYVKNAGREGRAKALIPLLASRMWNVGEESVRQLLYAAEGHGALRIDGSDWVIVKWSEYQGDSTAAERKQRQREREKEGKSRMSRVTPVSSREKEKDTEKESNPPKSPLPGGVPDSLKPITSELVEWCSHRKHAGKPVTVEAWNRTVAKLEGWGVERARIAIAHSIEAGWQGVFEPKSKPGVPAAPTRRLLSADEQREFLP